MHNGKSNGAAKATLEQLQTVNFHGMAWQVSFWALESG
jgi:hypothetical protein